MNLRPSGYEPDELPSCSIPRRLFSVAVLRVFGIVLREAFLSRFGGDLLSHVLRRSTIGVIALNGRVRDGIGCLAIAMTTKPRKKRGAFCATPSVPFGIVPSLGCLFWQRMLLLTISESEVFMPCCFWIKSSLSSN